MTDTRTDRWTPGPWQATRNGGAWLVLRGAWDVAGIDGTGEIAHSRYSAMTYEENAANARLISFAPELVEALRAIDHDFEHGDLAFTRIDYSEQFAHMTTVRALLARLDQEANT